MLPQTHGRNTTSSFWPTTLSETATRRTRPSALLDVSVSPYVGSIHQCHHKQSLTNKNCLLVLSCQRSARASSSSSTQRACENQQFHGRVPALEPASLHLQPAHQLHRPLQPSRPPERISGALPADVRNLQSVRKHFKCVVGVYFGNLCWISRPLTFSVRCRPLPDRPRIDTT